MDAKALVDHTARAIEPCAKMDWPQQDQARRAIKALAEEAGMDAEALRVASDDLLARSACGSHPAFVRPRRNAAALLRAMADVAEGRA